jgi:rhodanese-related sulfurtransferase
LSSISNHRPACFNPIEVELMMRIEHFSSVRVRELNNQTSTQKTIMKKYFALLAAAFMTATVYAGEFADISPKDVLSAAKAKTAVIIDVNGPDSYKAGHVPGALNWSEIKADLAAKLPADKNTLVIAYCGNPKCGAYLQAAKAAKKLGYTNVKHMSEGIAGWNEAKLPTETGR